MRRRGRLLAAVVVATCAMLLSGCAAAMAGDGDLSGDWAVLPEAKVPVPKSGVCRANPVNEKTVDWELGVFVAPPIACTTKHVSETYYVGNITDPKTVAATSRPEVGDATFKPIYSTCMKRAESFLGGRYYDARVSIVPVLPTDVEWGGGGRFYRCEMLEIRDDDETIVQRASSLKDGLRGKRPAAVGCANFKAEDDSIEDFTYVSCAKPHLTEYTGVYTVKDGKHPGASKMDDISSKGCFGVGASYLNMSSAGLNASYGYQWIYEGIDTVYWSIGDRGMRCFIGPYPNKKRIGSIKGKKPSQW